MKIKAINKNTEVYGYPMEMEYNNENFHGHQVGIALCVINDETKEVENNYISSKTFCNKEMQDYALGKLLNEEKAVFIEEHIVHLGEDGRLIPKTIFYMPYYVAEHSRFKPTVTDCNSINCDNFTIEILFVAEEGLNRYITIDSEVNPYIIDYLESLFDGFHFDENNQLHKAGVWYENDSFYLDFYNQAGQRFDIEFPVLRYLKDIIASVRLIKCEQNVGD